MLPPGSYDGKVVLVTGGGTGLGKGMVHKFSQLGAKVAIAARYFEPGTKSTIVFILCFNKSPEDVCQCLRQQLLKSQLRQVERFCLCSWTSAVADAVDKIEKKLGLPSVVVHNAAGS